MDVRVPLWCDDFAAIRSTSRCSGAESIQEFYLWPFRNLHIHFCSGCTNAHPTNSEDGLHFSISLPASDLLPSFLNNDSHDWSFILISSFENSIQSISPLLDCIEGMLIFFFTLDTLKAQSLNHSKPLTCL